MKGSANQTRTGNSDQTPDTANQTQTEQNAQSSAGAAVTSTAIPLRADKTLRGYSPAQVLTLQRTIGNKAVQQMVARTRQATPAKAGTISKPASTGKTQPLNATEIRPEIHSETGTPSAESATSQLALNEVSAASSVEIATPGSGLGFGPREAATPAPLEPLTTAPVEQTSKGANIEAPAAATVERVPVAPAAPVQRLSEVAATQVQRVPLSKRLWNRTKQTSSELVVSGIDKGKSIAVGGYDAGKSLATGGVSLAGDIAKGGLSAGKSLATGGIDLGGRIAGGGLSTAKSIAGGGLSTAKSVAGGGLDLGGRIAQGGLNAGKAIFNTGSTPGLVTAGGPAGDTARGMATLGSAIGGGAVATGGGIAGGLTAAGGGIAGGAALLGGGIAGGLTAAGGGLAGGVTAAGGGLAGGLTAVGGLVGAGLTATGGALAGGLTMAGGGIAGGLTALGGTLAGGAVLAGGAIASAAVYAGEKIYDAGAYVADKVGGYFDKRAKLAEAKQYYKEAANFLQEADALNFQTSDLYMWMNADLGYLNDNQDKRAEAARKVAELTALITPLENTKDKAQKATLKKHKADLKAAKKEQDAIDAKKINFEAEIPEAYTWALKAKDFNEQSEASKQVVDSKYGETMLEYKLAGVDYDTARASKAPALVNAAEASINDRTIRAKAARDLAAQSHKSMVGNLALLNARKTIVLEQKKRGEKLSTYIMKKIGAGILSAATLGIVSVNINKSEGTGGYSSKRSLSFGPLQVIRDTWKQAKIDWVNLKGLWKSRLMGPAPLTLFYGFLRFVGDHVIKPIRDILAVVSTISGVLSLVTSFFAPPLSAVLATIATVSIGLTLKLSIIKGILNGLLALWTLVTMLASDLWSRMSNAPTDNARNQIIRKNEATKQGMDTLIEGVRVAVPVGVTAGASINPNLPRLDARNAFSPGQEFSQLGNLGAVHSSATAGTQSALGHRWVEGSNLGINNVGSLSVAATGKAGETPALPAAIGGGRDYLVGQYNAEAEGQDPAAAQLRKGREDKIKETLSKVKAKLGELVGPVRENQTSQAQVITQLSAAQAGGSSSSSPTSDEQPERTEARESTGAIRQHLEGSQELTQDMSQAQSQLTPQLNIEAVREAALSGALSVESGSGS